MLSKLRAYRPSHGTVVAYLALFVALGGTSYGVATGSIGSRAIKNNSIRSKDIRNNNVRGKDIRTGTIRSSDVGNGSLLAQDFKAGQLPAGPQGPRGHQGTPGTQGPPGPTFGASKPALLFSGDPPASPDETPTSAASPGREFTFSLPSGGNVYLRYFSAGMWGTCTVGQESAGLYLDGAALPNTRQQVPASNAADQVVEWVAVAPAGAGQHTADLRRDCPSGNITSGFDDDAQQTWTALLLGG
jgi:hypothetical protein